MITLQQAIDSMVNQTPLYFLEHGNVAQIVPEMVGKCDAILDAIYTYDRCPRGPRVTTSEQWGVRGAHKAGYYHHQTFALEELFVDKQELIDIIIEKKTQEIAQLKTT